MLTMSRPAIVVSDAFRLENEYRSALWIYHRLLDFEDDHQRVLDAAAEQAAPGIMRVGRILARHRGAARVILRRGEEALASHAAE